MARPKDAVPVIDDVQIRLYVVIQGTVWTTSWYGPDDKMRFAALRYPKRQEMTRERYEALQAKAVRIFTRRIKELSKAFAGFIQPSHELDNLLGSKLTTEENEEDE